MIPEMEWVELVLPAGPLADEIGALLMDSGVAAAGLEIRGEEIVIWVPAAEAEPGLVLLRASVTRLANAGFTLAPETVYARPAAPENEWRDAWKRYFHIIHITPHIVIVPSWERYEALPGEIVLDLDPGRAFGTGAHASTKLCLGAIDELARGGHRVERFLDVGTGSGILAIAAAKMWPGSTGVAIDVDPIAVGAAAENLERNGVGRVEVSGATLDAIEGQFDFVLANIQADVLEQLRAPLVARVAERGALVLSGLLAEQAEPVAALFEQAGLRRDAVRMLDDDRDWSAVLLRRP